MSGLEITTLTFSLILGLSMAQMLNAVALSIRGRYESKLHWLPLVWAASIFLYHVQFWLALFAVDQSIRGWTWDWFGPALVMSVLLFLSGALVLPGAGRGLPNDHLSDFETHGRLALIPISLYLLFWIPMNARLEGEWLTAMNALDVILVALAAVAFFGRGARVRALVAVVYLAVTIWGVVWVWSPGAAS